MTIDLNKSIKINYVEEHEFKKLIENVAEKTRTDNKEEYSLTNTNFGNNNTEKFRVKNIQNFTKIFLYFLESAKKKNIEILYEKDIIAYRRVKIEKYYFYTEKTQKEISDKYNINVSNNNKVIFTEKWMLDNLEEMLSKMGDISFIDADMILDCFDQLGYKESEVENNKAILKLMRDFFKVFRVRWDDQDYWLSKVLVGNLNRLKNYKELIAFVYQGRFETEVFDTLLNILEQPLNNFEKIEMYQAYFKYEKQDKRIINLFGKDLNNEEFRSLIDKNKSTFLKSLAKGLMGEELLDINNIVENKYSCTVSFDYHALRASIKFKNKSAITNVFYQMSNSTDNSVGFKGDNYVTLIVSSDFPILNKSLENFISKNIMNWIKNEFNWDNEIKLFIADERKRILFKNLEESEKEQENKETAIKRKKI